jgi:Rrf2 family protein
MAVQISQKCQYAVRAMFELAKRVGAGPVKVGDIADVQAIPPRFLEAILNQLRKGGFVESWRGAAGGYALVRAPHKITLGEIIRFVEGPINPVACMVGSTDNKCPLHGDCVFLEVWEDAEKAMATVFDQTTFQDLIDRQASKSTSFESMFSI